MASLPRTGVKAASGYPQYSGSLITPMFGQTLIENFYCSTVFGEITTTDYMGELQRCGDQITFWRTPQINVRPYVKDMTLKRDTFEMKPIVLSIDKAVYFDFKIDHIDEQQICNWPQIKEQLSMSAARSAANRIDCEIMSSIYADAHKNNRGTTAGINSGCYDLGEIGAPVIIDKTNVLDTLYAMQAVLDEQCIPEENRWIVVPSKFKHLLLTAESCRLCFSGFADFESSNGRMPAKLAGFDIYVSHHVDSVIDPVTNTKAFNIVAGWRGATVFASTLEKLRDIEDQDSFHTRHQGLMVYGFNTVHDEALVHLYASLV